MLSSNKHECVPAALVNDVFACVGPCGEKVVENIIKYRDYLTLSLRPLRRIFLEAKPCPTGRQIGQDPALNRSIQSSDGQVALKDIAEMQEGIIIACLRKGGRVDHAVGVDTARGVIIGSEDESAIRLSKRNLELYGGQGTTRLRGARDLAPFVEELFVCESIFGLGTVRLNSSKNL